MPQLPRTQHQLRMPGLSAAQGGQGAEPRAPLTHIRGGVVVVGLPPDRGTRCREQRSLPGVPGTEWGPVWGAGHACVPSRRGGMEADGSAPWQHLHIRGNSGAPGGRWCRIRGTDGEHSIRSSFSGAGPRPARLWVELEREEGGLDGAGGRLQEPAGGEEEGLPLP